VLRRAAAFPLRVSSLCCCFQLCLYAELLTNPARTLQDFCVDLCDTYSIVVDRHFVGRTFSRWGISNKLIKRKHIAKFAIANIVYTGRYLSFILGLANWSRIKFADEASFCSKGASIACLPFQLCCNPMLVAQLCAASPRGQPRDARSTCRSASRTTPPGRCRSLC
jgi:hypothetical protein